MQESFNIDSPDENLVRFKNTLSKYSKETEADQKAAAAIAMDIYMQPNSKLANIMVSNMIEYFYCRPHRPSTSRLGVDISAEEIAIFLAFLDNKEAIKILSSMKSSDQHLTSRFYFEFLQNATPNRWLSKDMLNYKLEKNEDE